MGSKIFKPNSRRELREAILLMYLPNTEEAVLKWEKVYGHINTWDVSQITDMTHLFYRCNHFNEDISNWDVSNVISMDFMFKDCIEFNQDLSKWDTSKVVSFKGMFHPESKLLIEYTPPCFWDDQLDWDEDKKWDENEKDHIYKFETKQELREAVELYCSKGHTRQYAQQKYGFIDNWDVSKITDMSELFKGTNLGTYYDNISDWDVSNVTDMSRMFYDCPKFSEDLSKWNVSKVTNAKDIIGPDSIMPSNYLPIFPEPEQEPEPEIKTTNVVITKDGAPSYDIKKLIYVISNHDYDLNLFTTDFSKINDIITGLSVKTQTNESDWKCVEIKEEDLFETSEPFKISSFCNRVNNK